jgi:hypothetical protein
MKWEPISYAVDGTKQFPDAWLYPHYYESLNVLFRIENALRVFVFVVLKTTFEDKWLDINVTSDDAESATIGKIAKQRMAQSRKFGYLGYEIPCSLMYLTSGELIGIITAEPYWKYFSKYFPGSKEIIKNKLEEIGSVRNALAHFRPIKQDDLDLIKQNAQHVLLNVEKCLTDMLRCYNVVPTNTKDEWYKELKNLGTDYCTLVFNQSNDEKWATISIDYNCPVFEKRTTWRGNYLILTINTSSILLCFPNLKKSLIFLTERLDHPHGNAETPVCSKRLTMLFNREILTKSYKDIKTELEQVLHKISEETQLLSEDNLARGELIRGINIIGTSQTSKSGKSEWWTYNYDKLLCGIKESDPPEYWSNFNDTYIGDNYITATGYYPWMPVSIASPELPF